MEKRKDQKQQNQNQEDNDPLEPMEHQSGQTMSKPKPRTNKPSGDQDPLEPMQHQGGQSRSGSQKGFEETEKPDQGKKAQRTGESGHGEEGQQPRQRNYKPGQERDKH